MALRGKIRECFPQDWAPPTPRQAACLLFLAPFSPSFLHITSPIHLSPLSMSSSDFWCPMLSGCLLVLMKSSSSGSHPPTRNAKLMCLCTQEQGCPDTHFKTFVCHRTMASAAEKEWKLLRSGAAQHIMVLLNQGGSWLVMPGKLGRIRSSPILPAIPKQLAVQLLWSLARSTLLDAEEHTQVLGEIQKGRKQLDQDQFSLHIKVGLLKEKSGRDNIEGRGIV